jgi:hypothetical protein
MNRVKQKYRRWALSLFNESLLLIAFTVLFNSDILAQNTQVISLDPIELSLAERDFNIVEVSDERTDKTNIGQVHIGAAGFEVPLNFEQSFLAELNMFMQTVVPNRSGNDSVFMRIRLLQVSELLTDTIDTAIADLTVDFYSKNALLFHDVQKVQSKASDVSKHHAENIEQALLESLESFNDFRNRNFPPVEEEITEEVSDVEFSKRDPEEDYYVKGFEETKEKETPDLSTPEKRKKLSEEFNRNVFSIGYQIGGLTLIGADYEVRINDLFGVHAGAGIRGYNAGFRLHMRATKRSSFFDLSYKDGGFGLISMISSEFGSRVLFAPKRSDLGFHSQVGLGVLTHIDSEFARFLYGADPVPPIWLSFGVGLSW